MSKHGKYKKSYRKEWERESWARGWLREALNSENTNSLNEAFCKVCKVCLRAHKGDLMKHYDRKKHIANFQKYNLPSKQTLNNFVTLEITSEQKQIDLRFSVYIATHSAIRSINHLSELMSQIGQKIQLHRTKCSGLIKNVIAPCLLDELIEDLKNTKFSFIVDESTDKSVVKYLCICVKYYNKRNRCIQTNYLGIIELEDGTAITLYNCLTGFCRDNNIDIRNLIGIGTDGANNLCGNRYSLFSLLKEKNPILTLVRCICHSLNNASSKAAEELPANIDFLCREIYNWFQHSSNRKIEFKKIWNLINLNEDDKKFQNFVQLATTRWLCRYNVIKAILNNWLELKTHFSNIVNNEKCYTARLLKEMLEDDFNYLFLIILKPILMELNSLNLTFQKDNVDVGNAYCDLCGNIIVLAKKIMKNSFTDNNNLLIIINNSENDLAYLSPNKCDFGKEYFTTNKNIGYDKQMLLEERAQKYMRILLGEPIKRLPDHLNFFKSLQHLSPNFCLNPTLRVKFNDLPFLEKFITPENIANCEIQWAKLTTVDWVNIYGTTNLIDSYSFWPMVLNHKNAGGDFAFFELTTYALTCLSLPSSNAVVERVFSVMNTVKTKLRNKMQIKMLDSLLRIRTHFYVNKQCCKNFIPSESMFKKFNSKEVYKTDLSSQDEEDILCLNEF